MMYTYGGMGGFGGIMMLFWWIVGIALLVVAFRALAGNRDFFGSSGDSALHKLRERYAKGEIDKDEYLERKKVLAHTD